MSVAEQSFPTRCPNCTTPTAVATNPHCESASCPWLRCKCGAMVSRDGTFRIIPEGGGL